jgi:hypothetical protein
VRLHRRDPDGPALTMCTSSARRARVRSNLGYWPTRQEICPDTWHGPAAKLKLVFRGSTATELAKFKTHKKVKREGPLGKTIGEASNT